MGKWYLWRFWRVARSANRCNFYVVDERGRWKHVRWGFCWLVEPGAKMLDVDDAAA